MTPCKKHLNFDSWNVHVQLRVLEEALSDQRQGAAGDLEQRQLDENLDAFVEKPAAEQVAASCMLRAA